MNAQFIAVHQGVLGSGNIPINKARRTQATSQEPTADYHGVLDPEKT
jgi:hypothetical protein